MKKKNTGLKTLIALVVLLATCAIEANAQDKKTLRSEAVDPNSLLTESEKNSNFYFLDAVRYHLKAQDDSALVALSKAIELDKKERKTPFFIVQESMQRAEKIVLRSSIALRLSS